ncbi:glycosyltransferase [Polaromonas sp.]|uniref:glycosyltransferase family 2 protein n=1 Tax=Polaromonas sp. TaxID=1869339 RepID=UPI0017D96636|nr:glycosyltransferase [Polaromonas sp.]NMM05477.1 glycosyltransferase family 2 protein [Polaromonas sp.]
MKPENFSRTFPLPACRAAVIVKAFNKEKRIQAATESALRAVPTVNGEVVFADSDSFDRTVELAQAHPISIAQLAHPDKRSCGIGPQLGFQHSRGEFICLLDGDMQMLGGSLEQALALLTQHGDVAGTSGRVVEQNKKSLEHLARGERLCTQRSPGSVDRRDGGGLYRRSAIEDAGYLSDRNLHSYEEFDLAVRLRVLRWRLWLLPVDAANHFGQDAPPYRLLMQSWSTRYTSRLGELVRSAAGQPRLRWVLHGLRDLQLFVAVMAWWLAMVSIAFWPVSAAWRLAFFCALLTAPVLLMTWRKRSVTKAVYAVVSWCFNAAGLLRARSPARALISRRIFKEPAIPTAAVDANSDFLEPLPVPCKNRYESTSWFLPTPTFS